MCGVKIDRNPYGEDVAEKMLALINEIVVKRV
jgi:hypothetical protein